MQFASTIDLIELIPVNNSLNSKLMLQINFTFHYLNLTVLWKGLKLLTFLPHM
jgi:hypothetical protein